MASTSGSVNTGKGIKKPGTNAASNASPSGLYISVDFEVYGKVQKVHFRKYTTAKAKNLGLKGWCLNTENGTVIGTIQGPGASVNAMKTWLRSTGSPKSKIERVEFRNEKRLNEMDYRSFTILLSPSK